MITEALRHCPGIGPKRLAQLRELGVCTWQDVLAARDRLPPHLRTAVVEEAQRCLAALDGRDIHYFATRLAPADRWRVVAHYLEEASFFDIETAGLEHGAPISVIACWHRGQMHTFVEHENLDDFLALLDEATLLASFNGSTFDVPRVLDAFHIPRLPCPHIDLRWSCFHRGLRGGLKEIAGRLGIRRPDDLRDADGAMAVYLWHRWVLDQDQAARDKLLRYCAADVVLSLLLAQRLADRTDRADEDYWSHLPQIEETASATMCAPQPPAGVRPASTAIRSASVDSLPAPPLAAFGAASPTRLRARLRR